MRYPNVIYDFDGTLSDSYPCFANCFLDVLQKYGIEDTYENVYDYLKVSVGHCIKQYKYPVEDIKIISKDFHEFHNLRAPAEQFPMEGARELLEFVKANGGHNYIFSHSGAIVGTMLKVWGWQDLFDGILDATTPVERKPSPHGCYYLMGKYEMKKADTIIVGDRDLDTDSGRNAGIAGCLFDPEHYYDKTEVDYRVDRLFDVIDIIK